MTLRKKMIEVALPLEDINKACAREKSIRHGHPSTLHLWWARRPLAAARAVIFAQMVDDPSSHPELYPTEEDQERERERLFNIIRKLVLWESTNDEDVLSEARAEIWKSWRLTCAEKGHNGQNNDLFDCDTLPQFHDPFAGGGSLPLEAQRLGLRAFASDLNPVAVLINKSMIEIPPKFSGKPAVNPYTRGDQAEWSRHWRGAQNLAADVQYYGKWMRDEAQKRIGHLYPKVTVTAEMAKLRPDLQSYVGRELTVVAWLWARTVKSPNPAFANVDVPLVSTFMLSTTPGKEAYIEPVIEEHDYHFVVKIGKPDNVEAAKSGTKLARGANFRCLMSDTAIPSEYIKSQGSSGKMGSRMIAMVADGDRGRVFLSPTVAQEEAANHAKPAWRPEGAFVEDARAFTPFIYGLRRWQDLFTDRQLAALTTFSDLIAEAVARIQSDAIAAGMAEDGRPLREGGSGARAYAEAVAIYLAFAVSKATDMCNSLCAWGPTDLRVRHLFARQALPMVWDFAETSPLNDSAGAVYFGIEYLSKALELFAPIVGGQSVQEDATTQRISEGKVVSTDPPYYDNVPYADLSDFFYVWLRKSLRTVFPDLLATVAAPKTEELIAASYRHGGRDRAETFFLNGMTHAMRRIVECAHPAFPTTLYYAFKQSEHDSELGSSSTGWETFLEATISAGFEICGTWPVRTELQTRTRGMSSNALASSIVLVCRRRDATAPMATRREFIAALKAELPISLRHLQSGNIAPVDLAQSAIGPGMAIFTRYSKVVDADGKTLAVRDALALINEVLDEVLAQQEGDFDSETRFAIAWFEQMGFNEGEFGTADILARAKNTAVSRLVESRIAATRSGKLWLLKPDKLDGKWDPGNPRHSIWEVTHHLIRALSVGGESAAASLVVKLGGSGDIARELAYRLYAIADRKRRPADALAYNELVQSWAEIVRLSKDDVTRTQPVHAEMFTSAPTA